MGLQTYRFSTSWSRVRPDGGALNPKGIDFYKRLVDELLGCRHPAVADAVPLGPAAGAAGEGRLGVRDTADLFTEYALDMHDALGDRVERLDHAQRAVVLVVPELHRAACTRRGTTASSEGCWPPHHLLLGHGQTVRELRERDASLNLGITLNLTVAEPVDPADPADVDAARRIDGQFNRWFLDPIFRGAYPADIFDDFAR